MDRQVTDGLCMFFDSPYVLQQSVWLKNINNLALKGKYQLYTAMHAMVIQGRKSQRQLLVYYVYKMLLGKGFKHSTGILPPNSGHRLKTQGFPVRYSSTYF